MENTLTATTTNPDWVEKLLDITDARIGFTVLDSSDAQDGGASDSIVMPRDGAFHLRLRIQDWEIILGEGDQIVVGSVSEMASTESMRLYACEFPTPKGYRIPAAITHWIGDGCERIEIAFGDEASVLEFDTLLRSVAKRRSR